MILLLFAACQCNETARLDVPDVDRSSVRGTACYADDAGRSLELELGVAKKVNGRWTAPDGTLVLNGKRTGRMLVFESFEVELKGDTVVVDQAGEKLTLKRHDCGG